MLGGTGTEGAERLGANDLVRLCCRPALGTGALGDATLASALKGEAALTHGAEAFVELLREVDRFDLARLREGPLGNTTGF